MVAERSANIDRMLTPTLSSGSEFIEFRRLRYHCRIWETPGHAATTTPAPTMVLLHGWMDVGASFQFFVDALKHRWRVIAPDWRGYGLTEWAVADCYWIPDYLGDLEAILRHYSPDAPVNLVGHSMGGNVASLYSGIRPERIAKLANLEGFGLTSTKPDDAPKRYRRWFDELATTQRFRDYDDVAALAARLAKENPRLTAERASFLAGHWGERKPDGRVALRGDPAHKIVNAVQYNLDEAMACWRAITAPVLWVEGEDTRTKGQMRLTAADVDARKTCFASLQTVILRDAGHMVHHDQPEALAAAVEGFLHP